MTELPSLNESRLYRLLHTGNPGDEEFYLRAAADATHVLELGSGWGRLALALARAGHRVVGVELDAGFVNEALEAAAAERTTRSGSVEFVLGDLKEISLGRTFERIFIPYNTLYALGGTAGVTRAFERVSAHLAPGGELWLDVYAMDEFHAASLAGETPDDENERELVHTGILNGRDLTVFETSTIDLDAQRLDVIYEAEVNGALVGQGRLTHHYLLTSEIFECLEQSGLELLGIWGGFEGQPADQDAEHIIVCAAQPSVDPLADSC